MKLSELIDEAIEVYRKHGDLEVTLLRPDAADGVGEGSMQLCVAQVTPPAASDGGAPLPRMVFALVLVEKDSALAVSLN